MTRLAIPALCAVAIMTSAAAPASADSRTEPVPFAAERVPASVLAASHGAGYGYAVNYATMIAERARVDERMFAAVAPVSMDVWWAYTGSVLIAPNLI